MAFNTPTFTVDFNLKGANNDDIENARRLYANAFTNITTLSIKIQDVESMWGPIVLLRDLTVPLYEQETKEKVDANIKNYYAFLSQFRAANGVDPKNFHDRFLMLIDSARDTFLEINAQLSRRGYFFDSKYIPVKPSGAAVKERWKKKGEEDEAPEQE